MDGPRNVRLAKRIRRIIGNVRRRWHFGDEPPVGAIERERAIGLSFDAVALLVDGAVMPAAEHREIRQRGRAAARPMPDVMPLPDAHAAAGEATSAVAMVQRSPDRGRNRPCPGADLDEPPLRVVPHDHAAGIAREALGRFRGNACAVLEDRLAGVLGIGEDAAVDVHDDLVPLARGAGVDTVMERRLG